MQKNFVPRNSGNVYKASNVDNKPRYIWDSMDYTKTYITGL